MKIFTKLMLLSITTSSLFLSSCGDDDKKSSSSIGDVPTTVEEVSGPALSNSEASSILAMNSIPTITDANGAAAIGQAKAVTSSFSSIFSAMPAPSLGKNVSQIADTSWTYTYNGITFTMEMKDLGTKVQMTYKASGTSETTGQAINGTFYEAVILKSRRAGYMKYNYGIFWDVYSSQTEGYEYDGYYQANFTITESGKLNVVYSSEVTGNINQSGQNYQFDYNYGGTVTINADKSGKAEASWDTNVSGQHQTGNYCTQWNAQGVSSDC